MKKTIQLLFPLILIASLLASCSSAANSQQSINDAVMNTMVALNVQSSKTAAAVNAINQATGTAAAAITPTLTLTPTVMASPTPGEVWLTINENTNCRKGPGNVYDMVTTLLKGTKVQSVARNFASNFYYIKIPDQDNAYCWVWGQYVSIAGDPTPLPIYTPLPTPTPSPTPTPIPGFVVASDGISNCGSSYTIRLKIENTGGVKWESVQLSIRDRDTHDSMSFSSNNFVGYSSCSVSSNTSALLPGMEAFVSNKTGDFNYDPTGHSLSITLTLYSKDDLTGISISKQFNTTP